MLCSLAADRWTRLSGLGNFPEDPTQDVMEQLSSKMYNASHALEICHDPKKSVVVWPPQGHGPKPPRAGYSCYDMSANGVDPPFNINL